MKSILIAVLVKHLLQQKKGAQIGLHKAQNVVLLHADCKMQFL